MGGTYKSGVSKHNTAMNSAMDLLRNQGATRAKQPTVKKTVKIETPKSEPKVAVKETEYIPAHIRARRANAAKDGNEASLARGN